MAELATQYQQFYVYTHKDPRTSNVVYVGYGSGQRAWMMLNSTYTGPRYGHRSKEHHSWYKQLEALGFTLEDIVKIQFKNLSKEKAKILESTLIKAHKPIFNIQQGLGSMTDPKLKEQASSLRKEGKSYSKIALIMKLKSTMSAWRYVNG